VLFDNGGGIGCESIALGNDCQVTYGTTNLELVSSAGVFNVKNKSGGEGVIYDSNFNPVPQLVKSDGVFNVTDGTNTGRIYDTQFNPLPTPFTVSVISLASGQSGIITNSLFNPTVAAGLYQLQLTIPNISPGSEYLQANVAQNAANQPYSIITVPVTSVISGQQFTFTSGCFSLVAGDINCGIDTNGTNWTGTNWSVQLVRYA